MSPSHGPLQNHISPRVEIDRDEYRRTSRIFERIDIRREEVQTGPCNVGVRPGFRRDHSSNILNHWIVERGGEQNGHWEASGIAVLARIREVDARTACEAVQGLGPPLVRWQAQPSSAVRDIKQIGELLRNVHGIDYGGRAGGWAGAGVADQVGCEELWSIDAIWVVGVDSRLELGGSLAEEAQYSGGPDEALHLFFSREGSR